MCVTLNREILVATWLWITGLVGLSVPFFLWPRHFGGPTVLHVAVFVTALAIVIANTGRGRLFDGKRSFVRGVGGVAAFGAVLFGSVLAYRWLIL